ncbi:MAG: HigA family addiction module antitoxin [Candidatus Eremiobacteraeota bacterium]|nr:HigA family addiction module antitoxin [Candidatus Eremiobacteraeota bacterium]
MKTTFVADRTAEAVPDGGERNRRQPAPHPGPSIKRKYLDPLGVRVATLAAHIGMQATALQPMLAGETSIDVETAIRLGRALQLNPQIIMERQVKHDFLVLRDDEGLESIDVLPPDGRFPFPEKAFLRGRLAGLRETWGYGDVRPETLGFLADAESDGQDLRLRLHELGTGSRLRVYAPNGEVLWVGVVMETLEGQPLLPSVRPGTWIGWFVQRYRADFTPAR